MTAKVEASTSTERSQHMPIGKGRVRVLNNKIGEGAKTTPVARYKDNTSDIEAAALRTTQQYAHIRIPDDARGTRTRRGSLDSGNAGRFTGTVVVAPTTHA